MADIVDINISQTVETVDIIVTPNLVTVNINQITGGGGGDTNLGYTPSPTNGIVTSDTGTDATIPLADATNAGLLTPAEKTKIANSVPYSGATANVDLGEFELKSGQLTLDTTPTGTAAVGTTRWNDALGSSETTLKGGSVILKNGVDLVARIVNKVTPNTTLTKANYQAVKVSGATGQRLSVELAQGNNDLNSADTIGLVTETISTNQEGFIITMGQIENINTTGSLQGETWADGDVLYLSPSVAGKLTNIKPNGSNGHIIVIGYVEYAHANNGKIYVKIMNGWELDELHNVYINNPLNSQALIYETSTQLWKNKTIGIQQILDNGNTTNTGIIVNSQNETGVLINLSAESTGFVVSTVVGDDLSFPILLNNDQIIYFQIDSGGNLTTSGFLEAQSIRKSGGLSNEFLMADGSVSSGGIPPINPYSFLVNNTNVSAIPTSQPFKNLTNKTYSGTIVWTGGTAPSGATQHTYSLSQIGNLVTLTINLSYATAGAATLTSVACELPNTAPTPALPASVTVVGDILNYGSGMIFATKTLPATNAGICGLRIKSLGTPNVYEIAVARTAAAYRYAYITIQYFV